MSCLNHASIEIKHYKTDIHVAEAYTSIHYHEFHKKSGTRPSVEKLHTQLHLAIFI
uniref:Uncharacterized protein n=1 Tax=Rhizophora mucronata TaxID=61149 RepID=A0A2P2QTT0_RHIMU